MPRLGIVLESCRLCSSSNVVCNIGWEQIIWKASNALCLCKLYEILTKLIYGLFFPPEHILYSNWFTVHRQSSRRLILRNAATILISVSQRQGVIIPFHILCFLLIRSVPVNAALLVEVTATEPQAFLNTALFLTARVPGGTCYYNIMGLNRQQYSIWSEVRSAVYLVKIFLKGRYDTLFSKAISRDLKAEQKGRVHREQKELHFKHVTRNWGPPRKIGNDLEGFYRLQI